MSRKADQYNGVILLDKPSGITSHDAVAKVRKLLGQKSVGHCGTLDPVAEGLLVICVGQATKVARFLSSDDKRYLACVTLGMTSETYDAEGISPDTISKDIPELNQTKLESLLDSFRGEIKQCPPIYSAIHVNGERLYKAARRGESVELPERDIVIHELKLLSYKQNSIEIEVHCSKGTYIRSLAHDIGQKLGCGAYLSQLKRVASGKLMLEDALTLEELQVAADKEDLNTQIKPIGDVLSLPDIMVNDDFCRYIIHGQRPSGSDLIRANGEFSVGDHILVKDQLGTVLAVGRANLPSSEISKMGDSDILTYDRVIA